MVCVYGIAYYDYLVSSAWKISQAEYIDIMNHYLYPFLLMLLVSLGLCIPKRLLHWSILVPFSVVVLITTLLITFSSDMVKGLGFMLAVMVVVQSIVVILTFRRSKSVRFEKDGNIVKLGSSLLHLGVVILIFNFVSLRDFEIHILIFWTGTGLITIGNIFSFYPGRVEAFLSPSNRE